MTKKQISQMLQMSTQLSLITDAQIQARENLKRVTFCNPVRLARLKMECKLLVALLWFFNKCLYSLDVDLNEDKLDSFGINITGTKVYYKGAK